MWKDISAGTHSIRNGVVNPWLAGHLEPFWVPKPGNKLQKRTYNVAEWAAEQVVQDIESTSKDDEWDGWTTMFLSLSMSMCNMMSKRTSLSIDSIFMQQRFQYRKRHDSMPESSGSPTSTFISRLERCKATSLALIHSGQRILVKSCSSSGFRFLGTQQIGTSTWVGRRPIDKLDIIWKDRNDRARKTYGGATGLSVLDRVRKGTYLRSRYTISMIFASSIV